MTLFSSSAASEGMSTPPGGETVSWSRDLLLLALALMVWFGLFLGSRPLNNPDEGRYTEIPREMAATGDYVTPRLDGVKYFEKPPLVYWLSALTFEVTGVNEWSARFWGAAFAVLGGLMTYAAGRALHGRIAGLWAAVVLSTSILYYGLSRIILLDLVVAVAMGAALFAFLLGMREPAGPRRRWLFWVFYASMALAVLTKGLIGLVLPCAVAFVWVLVCNQWRALRPCHPFSGSAILLAITVPWHVLAALRNPSADGTVWPGYVRGLALHHAGQDPGWMWFYFVREHFLRFTTTEHGRFEPWWFFPPVLIAGLFPWAVFAWQAARKGLADGWRARVGAKEIWFLVIWVVFIVAFFSKSQSKLVPYILPVFPAVAVLIGSYLAEAWTGRRARGLRAGLWVFAGLALALGLAAAVLPLLLKKKPELVVSLAGWRVFLALLLGGGAVAVAGCLRRDATRAALIVMTAVCAVFFTAGNLFAVHFDRRTSKSLALLLKPRLQARDEVFVVFGYVQDFPVYLDHLVSVVSYHGELAYGIDAEPGLTARRFLSTPAFLARWREAQPAYALVGKATLGSLFSDNSLPRSVIGETPYYVLLANHSP